MKICGYDAMELQVYWLNQEGKWVTSEVYAADFAPKHARKIVMEMNTANRFQDPEDRILARAQEVIK